MSCYASSHLEQLQATQEEIERLRDSKLDRILQLAVKQNEEIAELKRQGEASAASISTLATQVKTLETQFEEYRKAEESSKDKTLPRQLSAKVKALHSNLDPSQQFLGDEAFSSPHNSEVTRILCDQISEKDPKKCSKIIYKAVKRYHESRRRKVNDNKPERQEQVARNKHSTKRYQRKKQLHTSREKMVKPGELKHWHQVPLEAMSSESELEGQDDTLVRHPPSWRSEALESFIIKLDKRAMEKELNSKKKSPLNKKKRIRGLPVERPIPPGIKQWMVKKDNRQQSFLEAQVPLPTSREDLSIQNQISTPQVATTYTAAPLTTTTSSSAPSQVADNFEATSSHHGEGLVTPSYPYAANYYPHTSQAALLSGQQGAVRHPHRVEQGQQEPHTSYMTPGSSMPSFSAPSWHGFSQQSVESEVTPSRNVSRYSAARVLAETCSEADLEESDSDFELDDN